MAHYEILVGNVGKAHETDSEAEARNVFNIYVKRSREWNGRCGGEPVTLMRDGEIVDEHPWST